MYPAVLTDH